MLCAADHEQYVFIGVTCGQFDLLMRILPDAEDFIGKALSYGFHAFEVQFNRFKFFQPRQYSAGLRPGNVFNLLVVQLHPDPGFTELE